ncbi:MAG: trypsin-like peptidase domain-containing protein [Phycisphaerae bacterium]|nr:trypsin-like peptidase domain-containing protein [Phycisphaerae bacterium]
MRSGWILLFVGMSVFLVGCDPQPAEVAAGGTAKAGDFRQVVKSAETKVFPAVVFIQCLQESLEGGKKITREIVGSGVLIAPDGGVLSNWHVVDKAVEVRCLLSDGRAFDADVVGTDKDTDLSLLQLRLGPDAKPLPHATLGDSDALHEGDFVMAMGAPWGLNRSVSIGIVSCTRRYLPEHSEYSLWLQTDASISPGNSGGPLVNTAGEVIGINTRGASVGGDMGFAIPAQTVRIIVRQLREFKKVNWSWTGLQLQPLKDFRKNIYFSGEEGVIVAETDPQSPARRAGIKVRDRILKINDQPVTAVWEEDLPAVRRALGMLPKNTPAKITLQRGRETLNLELTPREKGTVEGEELDCPRWDMTVKAVNQFDNEDLYFYRTEGVFVYGVKYPGNAAEAGLREKDILLRVGEKEVTTLADVKQTYEEAMKNLKSQHRVVVTVLRNGLMQQIVLDFARDYEKE